MDDRTQNSDIQALLMVSWRMVANANPSITIIGGFGQYEHIE